MGQRGQKWGVIFCPYEFYHEKWSNFFRNLALSGNKSDFIRFEGENLVPMAGRGSRFKKAGYSISKPLIKFLGSNNSLILLNLKPSALGF